MIAGHLGDGDGSMWWRITVDFMLNQEVKKWNTGALLSPSPF